MYTLPIKALNTKYMEYGGTGRRDQRQDSESNMTAASTAQVNNRCCMWISYILPKNPQHTERHYVTAQWTPCTHMQVFCVFFVCCSCSSRAASMGLSQPSTVHVIYKGTIYLLS